MKDGSLIPEELDIESQVLQAVDEVKGLLVFGRDG